MPGLIIIYVRAQFLAGRLLPHRDAVLSYFSLSVVCLAIVEAIGSIVTGSRLPLAQQTQYWLPILLVGSAVFGALVGLNASFGGMRWLMSKFGVSVPHAFTNAWDWRFRRLNDEPERLVIVTLKDGSRVFGCCGEGSFSGSDPQSRDLYVSQVYDVDERGTWVLKTRGRGIYFGPGEVRVIEFVPMDRGAVE